MMCTYGYHCLPMNYLKKNKHNEIMEYIFF